MDALGIVVGIVLIAILLIAGTSLPDSFNFNFTQIFYLVIAILACAVSFLVFKEADL
jgi:hypothetical protein